ncbi:multidrug effflux MFS transporter [Varunaivibrio sulfuroxidans]|uniref:Bcr/CflA family efflux transporter n=1 Tax=Varunaivibrio sulfuroxidans TaxID=1773489 RepID=A0A4R3J9N1_9PROT|nr:multidrug effflux MFS transporter [Varunaivibrio sulfuroxidans]TCS62115.1 DHA1 family 2-module integral membrane pump EmrD-like MFS transporter [Varunaivibrio sulfuroxidans]WES30548.1 multidrug effflux MFS transporter [Varunaivibrio sulfuroxidans]
MTRRALDDRALARGEAIFLILTLIVMGQASIDIYLPSMPAMASDFNVNSAVIQLTVSLFLLGYGFSQLFYGPLSDHYGRRAVLFFGLPLFTVSTIACVLTHSAGWLLFFRLCEGVGIGTASVSARSIMRDCFSSDELPRISSYMAMAWALVPTTAPMIGGYIQNFLGWRSIFLLLVALSILLSVYVFSRVPETNKHTQAGPISLKAPFHAYKTVLSNKTFGGNMLVLSALFSIFSIFNAYSAFLFEVKWGASPVIYGWILLFISFGYMLGSFLNSRLIALLDVRRVTSLGMAVIVLTSGISVLMHRWGLMNGVGLALVMFLTYAGLGLIFANSIAASLRPFPKIAGSASAMYGFLVFTGGFASSAIFIKLLHPGLGVLVTAFLVLSLAMALTFMVMAPNRPTPLKK